MDNKERKKKTLTTRKKVKVVGTKKFIDQETGEIKEMNVVEVEERDANFHKIWLAHIISALDSLGYKKIKVMTFIMENLNSENYFMITHEEMEKRLGISRKTISETMKSLQEINFLKKIRAGLYQIDPDTIYKGGKNDRLNVLYQYKNISTKQQEEIEELEDN